MRIPASIRWPFAVMLAVIASAQVWAQGPVNVTVEQLVRDKHVIEVQAGTPVLWADARFDRVWLSSPAGRPKVDRVAGGFRAVFGQPGTYKGGFTVVGSHAPGDVYPMTVRVSPAPR